MTTQVVRNAQNVPFPPNSQPAIFYPNGPVTVHVPAGVSLTVQGTCDTVGLAATPPAPAWAPLASQPTAIAGPKIVNITESVAALLLTPTAPCTIFMYSKPPA